MELERAIARLAEACDDLETVAVQKTMFHSRRAERIKNENAALHRTNVQMAQGLDAAIARVRTVLGG
jgi:hypothetical protein